MREPVEDLIRQHQKHLFAAAFSVCQNASDADDVVQDTFLKYHLSKKEFSSPEHIKAWLLRVAINKAKDINRRTWRWNTVSLEEVAQTLTTEQSEDTWLLAEVMKLPAKYRIVLHLFYYEDYSVAEIANILKVSDGSVKTRLSRARSMLKNNLEEDLVYE
ncbi:MAG: RNA polymerase sigma factor [Lachnospiraceae bacterium]|nr:RNA polymerase sigma factor [Lachnospiraceae bacterium]